MIFRCSRGSSAALILVPIITLASMFLYQWVKHYFTPEIGVWESHIHTNLFVTAVVSIFAFFLNRYLHMRSLLAAIAESSSEAIIGTDLDGVVTAWNKGAEKVFGYSVDEMRGKPLSVIIPPDKPEDPDSVLRRIEKAERVDRYETVRLRKDGARIHVSITASPLLNPSGKVIGASAIVSDITERKMAEEALRRSEARLARAKAFSLTMTAHLGLDGRWIDVPAAFCSLLGYSVEEMLARPFEAVTHPDDFDLERGYCRDLIDGEMNSVDFEKRCITRDGRSVWINLNYATVTDAENNPAYFLVYIRDISKRKKAEEELERYHSHLEDLVDTRTKALTEANEQLRKEIFERRRAEQSLQESSEKLKFFAYSIVHDLKSPSIGIHGLTRRLNDCFGDQLGPMGRTYCEQILKASGHVADLIDKINIFIATKEAPLTIERIDTKEMAAGLRNEFSERLQNGVKWVEPESLPEIRADRTSILRVLRNFIDNALKYGGDKLREVRLDCTETKKFFILSVSDDGGSLGTEDVDKIFEVFQRTQSSHGVSGTGLGLAIAKEIAERHGGIVWVEPESERGKTFYLSISKSL